MVHGSEDRKHVLPVLVSCQKEAGPLIQADFREEIASGEELPGRKSELKQLGEKQAVVFTVVLWNV